MAYTPPEFPKYDYTYVIEQLLFDQGTMLVKFTPTDIRLAPVTYNIPIFADIDVNNIKPYLDNFAPNDKWFAQDTILNHGSTLVGTA